MDLAAHWPLVLAVARRVAKRTRKWSMGELASFGYDGLVSALRCYRPQPQWPFKRYAGYRIYGAILDGMSRKHWHPTRNVDENVRLDQLPAPAWCDDEFEHLIRPATPKGRELLRLYYRDGWELADIGRQLSVTESRVCQMLSEARLDVKLAAGDSRGESKPASNPSAGSPGTTQPTAGSSVAPA